MSLLRQTGGVEALMPCQVSACSALPLRLLARGFDAIAAFVTTIGALHDLHAFAKEKALGRRSRIPASCAGCLVFLRPLFAHVHEVTSEKRCLDCTSLHPFEDKHQAWLYLACILDEQPQAYKSRSARVRRRRVTRVRVLDYVG